MIKQVIMTVMLSSSASAFAADVPGYFRIRSLSYAGSMCPANSILPRPAADASKVSFWFDARITDTGPGAPLSDKRKNCQVNLDLDHPAGWQYALIGVKAPGGVILPRGSSASFHLTNYLSGSGSTFRVSQTFRGPLTGEVLVDQKVAPTSSSLVWSRCGAPRSVNVNMQVIVDGRDGQAAIPGSEIMWGEPWTTGWMDLVFAWKRCP